MEIAGLSHLLTSYVRETSSFIRSSVRKQKFLISDQQWKNEKEKIILLIDKIKKVLGQNQFDTSGLAGSKNTLYKYASLLLNEIEDVANEIELDNDAKVIERLEYSLALTYAINVCFPSSSSIPSHFFLLTEEEMGWMLK